MAAEPVPSGAIDRCVGRFYFEFRQHPHVGVGAGASMAYEQVRDDVCKSDKDYAAPEEFDFESALLFTLFVPCRILSINMKQCPPVS
jgi:hypothetical protein